MNPEAISVPLFNLASFTSFSLLRLPTYHEMAPPTNSGRLRSIGMNIPRANGKAGIFRRVRIMAMAAPIPYSSHGAPPPFIIGWMTAAIAFA